jgi:hypothetical protein
VDMEAAFNSTAELAPLSDESYEELHLFVSTLIADDEQTDRPAWLNELITLTFNAGRAFERGNMSITVDMPLDNAEALINFLLGGDK